MSNDFNDKWQKIGALWPTKSGKGWTGKVTQTDNSELSIAVFKNNKTKPSQPEYNIYISKEQQEQPQLPEPPPTDDDDSAIPF